jgi:hypothetical protein
MLKPEREKRDGGHGRCPVTRAVLAVLCMHVLGDVSSVSCGGQPRSPSALAVVCDHLSIQYLTSCPTEYTGTELADHWCLDNTKLVRTCCEQNVSVLMLMVVFRVGGLVPGVLIILCAVCRSLSAYHTLCSMQIAEW